MTWNFDPRYVDPAANMYGYTRCPFCGDHHRAEFNNRPGVVQCDECGCGEPVVVHPDVLAEEVEHAMDEGFKLAT